MPVKLTAVASCSSTMPTYSVVLLTVAPPATSVFTLVGPFWLLFSSLLQLPSTIRASSATV